MISVTDFRAKFEEFRDSSKLPDTEVTRAIELAYTIANSSNELATYYAIAHIVVVNNDQGVLPPTTLKQKVEGGTNASLLFSDYQGNRVRRMRYDTSYWGLTRYGQHYMLIASHTPEASIPHAFSSLC